MDSTITIAQCPTCGAPAKMTWSGLDLVAETGDETLASKHYEYQPNGNNTVLAPSGPTAIDFLRDEVKKAKPFTHGGLNQLPYMFFDAVAQAMENYLAACTTAKGEERKD